MPDESNKEESSIPPVQNVEIIGANDWFLRSIIDTVSQGVEIGVTLNVGGTIVSGILISGKKYFEELGDGFSTASQEEGDIQSVLGEGWKQYTQIYDKPEGAPDDWQAPPVSFIHLRGAKFFAAGQAPIPTNRGLLWRGKLSSVDGFSLGNLSAD